MGSHKENASKQEIIKTDRKIEKNVSNVTPLEQNAAIKLTEFDNKAQLEIKPYRRTAKPKQALEARAWRTRKDPFDQVWNKIRIQLELSPEKMAKNLLAELIAENPEPYNYRLLRTLERRVAKWRMEKIKNNQVNSIKNTLRPHDTITAYFTLVAHAIINE